jgi:hypothetical protein
MAEESTPQQEREPSPWDRDFVVNARSRRKRTETAASVPTADGRAPQPAGTAPGRHPPRQRADSPHPIFLLAPWAGLIGLACALFAAVAWLFGDRGDLSTATVVLAVVGLALGAYAVAGAFAGRGRSDIAVGALVLASVALLMWVWMGRPTPVLRPT